LAGPTTTPDLSLAPVPRPPLTRGASHFSDSDDLAGSHFLSDRRPYFLRRRRCGQGVEDGWGQIGNGCRFAEPRSSCALSARSSRTRARSTAGSRRGRRIVAGAIVACRSRAVAATVMVPVAPGAAGYARYSGWEYRSDHEPTHERSRLPDLRLPRRRHVYVSCRAGGLLGLRIAVSTSPAGVTRTSDRRMSRAAP